MSLVAEVDVARMYSAPGSGRDPEAIGEDFGDLAAQWLRAAIFAARSGG